MGLLCWGRGTSGPELTREALRCDREYLSTG
jgi:hypothetical protein